MLLRRISEHVKSQNWFAVCIDLLVVIFGVYAGLQVSAWNEEQQDRVEEIEYLERILADLDDNISTQQASDSFQKNTIDNADWLIVVLDRGIIPQDQEQLFGQRLYELGRTNPLRYRNITLNEMISAGKLGLIQDTKLRSSIGNLAYVGPQFQNLANKPELQNAQAITHTLKYVNRVPNTDGSYYYEYNERTIIGNPELRNAIFTSRNMSAAVWSFSQNFTEILINTRAEVQTGLNNLIGKNSED